MKIYDNEDNSQTQGNVRLFFFSFSFYFFFYTSEIIKRYFKLDSRNSKQDTSEYDDIYIHKE